MIQRFSIILILALCVSAFSHAMNEQQDEAFYETLETQFREMLAKHRDKDESEVLNAFLAMQMHALLSGPDNIEQLNRKIAQSREAIPNTPNAYKAEPELQEQTMRAKGKYNAFFAFIKKYQSSHTIEQTLLSDLEKVEKFAQPIQMTLGIIHEGKPMPAHEFLALPGIDPAEKEMVRIYLLEHHEVKTARHILDGIPSARAITKLPEAMQILHMLEQKYANFVRDYPQNENRQEFETKLGVLKKMMASFPSEYTKAQPSKKEVEKFHAGSFLQSIRYSSIQQLCDALPTQAKDEQLRTILQIKNIEIQIRKYLTSHPTLDTELKSILTRAANRILEVLEPPVHDDK